MTLKAIVGGKVFRMGMSGPAVTAIQVSLAGYGYPLKATGDYYGSATDAAVTDFQRRHGLAPDGDVGPATAAALDAQPSGTASAAAVPAIPIEVARPLWLTISLSHVGLREGRDDAEIVRDVQEVAKDYFHSSTPWCAGWVSFCLARAGEKPSATPLWALSYSEPAWGIKLKGPALGAIAVKHRQGGGHVTMVAGRTSSGRLACCGGNQGDAVSVEGYPASAFDGFYWPKDVPLPAITAFSALPLVNNAGKVLSEA